MPRHNAYRSRGTVEAVGSEWSSGQLGIGIAVAVIFGLVCFILGYVVANVDRPLEDDIVAVSGEIGGKKAETPEATAPAEPRGVPAPSNTPPAVTPSAGEPAGATRVPPRTPSGPSVDPAQRPGVTKPEIEALPTPGGPTPMVKTPVNIAVTGGAGGPASPAGDAKPVTDPPPIVPPSASGSKPASGGTGSNGGEPDTLESVSAPPKAPAPAVQTPPAKPPVAESAGPKPPTVTRGSYGIQIAAFNGPRRAEQATEARKHLKEATGLDAEIVKTADGAYEKVIITGFATPEAAKAQCEKLKEKAGYASSWVVPVR